MVWNTSAFQLLIISATGGFTGLFEYSPVPGAGNLVASITPAAGTDPYGNHYPAGVNSQATGATPAQAVINAGSLEMTPGGALAGTFGILTAIPNTVVLGGVAFQMTTPLFGSDRLWIQVGSGGGAPAFATGWGNFGSSGAQLSFRKVASPPNCVWINGIVKPAVGAGTLLFTLPAFYVPLSVQVITGVNATTGGSGYWVVDTSGNVNAGAFGGIITGDEYTINGLISLDI